MRAKGDLWLPRVRAAIPRCAEPFTTYDVCKALAVDPGTSARYAVFDALCKLTDARELTKRVVKRDARRATAYFERTNLFREREFDFAAQRSAAAFLQGLAVHWGNERNRGHAAAE